MQTHGGCQWTLGEWKETSGNGELCSDGWLHCYSSPLLAVMLNPIHANISNPRLFEIETDGRMLDDNGLKQGFTRMRLVREIPLPEITTTQRIAFGILCAKRVCRDADWNTWADGWLSGTDRSYGAYTDADATTYTAAYAAAVYAAAYTAYAVAAAAAYAVDAAADAYATRADAGLNLIDIANEAMKY
ncbi:MAG: hypothetical protein PHU71_06315 [Candidatus Gracilibacteria bacterium]|nr:hypothetical protein [Candidatus Gracilibacteria bacterium]